MLKGSTSAPFFCHAEINNRWFVFNAQFPLYYYRQYSNGLALRQNSHDSLSLFLSLFFLPLPLFFCSMPNGLHKCCMHVKQHLITESLLGLLVRAWKNGRVCFGFSVQTLKQEWNMSLTLLKMTFSWEECEHFGWYLRLCAHSGGDFMGIVSQANKTKRIITRVISKADWNTKQCCFMERHVLIFLWMLTELMFIQIGWNITPQTIKGPFKFRSASCTLVGFLWCHLSNFVPFSNTFVKIYQSQIEKKISNTCSLTTHTKENREKWHFV